MAANTEVGFYSEKIFQENFDQNEWPDVLEGLKKVQLTEELTEKILRQLLNYVKQDAGKVFLGLKCLLDCLLYLTEFQAFVQRLQLPTDPFVVLINDSLSFSTYLSSKEMLGQINLVLDSAPVDDNSEGTKSASHFGSDNINQRLLVLYHLFALSPAYSTFQSLVSMGLSAENKEKLEIFVAKRKRALASWEKTGIILDTLGKVEANAILQVQYDKVLDKVKRKNFEAFLAMTDEFFKGMIQLYTKQKELLKEKELKVSGKELEQVTHQLTTLQTLEDLRTGFLNALDFFARKELAEGIKLVDRMMILHQQMMQICDNSVALIFIGLIKTGKSTIVDTIIGENVSPSRVDPMTAIPVRYIHDPHTQEPVMLVPFALRLNNVVRVLKNIIQEKGKDYVNQKLTKTHLRDLVNKIDRGLIFKDIYVGAKDVLEASIDIHDIFRLAVQDVFPPTTGQELPLEWNQGLDSFLTVSAKFPNSDNISSHVKLSVIDTPGVNEEGVKKLDLNKVIADSVDVSHYVAFTLMPRNNDAKDNTKLKQLIKRIATTSRTPTLVLATNADTLGENEFSNAKQNISDSLRESDQPYPIDNVFIVSGKRKLLGEKGKEYALKFNKKPPLDDPDAAVKKFAEDWALTAGYGDGEEEKKEYYENLSVKKFIERCDSLIKASKMHEPMDKMLKTATEKAGILSCNKALEKALECNKQMKGFLMRLITANEADNLRASDLMAICEEVNNQISEGVLLIRQQLHLKMDRFRRDLTEKSREVLEEFSQNLGSLVDPNDTWDFKKKEDADMKVTETLRAITQNFSTSLDRILEDKQNDLKNLMDDLREDTRMHIFVHLQRIGDEVNDKEEFNPELSKTDIQLDTTSLGFNANVITSQEKSTTMKSKLSSLLHMKMFTQKESIFVVDYEVVKTTAADQLKDYTENMIKNACIRVEKSVSKVLDGFFLQGLRKVGQLREALNEREKLKAEGEAMRRLFQALDKSDRELHNLLKDLVASDQ